MTSQKVKDFDFFSQKFKTLRKFDILTKFEDNWSTRTVVGNFTSNPLPPPPPENDLFFSYFGTCRLFPRHKKKLL